MLEQRLLQVIEHEILSPQAVAYLTEKVNGALQRANHQSISIRRSLEAELREAEREAENIKQAVRYGKATATLLDMLETVVAVGGHALSARPRSSSSRRTRRTGRSHRSRPPR